MSPLMLPAQSVRGGIISAVAKLKLSSSELKWDRIRKTSKAAIYVRILALADVMFFPEVQEDRASQPLDNT